MIFTLCRGRLCFLFDPVKGALFPNKSGHLSPATYFDVLPQLLHDLLNHRIQHTEYRSPCGLLSRTSRSLAPTLLTGVNHKPFVLHDRSCLQRLEQSHYPFWYQFVEWFCNEGQHHLLPLLRLALPFEGRLSRSSFRYFNFAVTSTSFSVKEVSRLSAGLPNWSLTSAGV